MSFAERLRNLRKEKGLTQNELADKAGMNGRHMSRYETGALKPPQRTIRRLAEALGVSVEELTQDTPQLRAQDVSLDPELLEQFQSLSRMDEEDRKAVKRILSALLMKQQMQDMLLQAKVGA